MNLAVFIGGASFIAVAFANGTVQLRSLPTLKVIWASQLHHGQIRKITSCPDAALLASISTDQKLVISDLSQGKPIVAKPFGFIPLDCEFASTKELVVAGPGGQFFWYYCR